MKHRSIAVIVAATVALGGVVFVQPKHALAQNAGQQLPTVVMAIVDVQRIMRVSAASVSIRDQIDQVRSGFQADLDAKEERLRKTDEDLKRQRAILAPAAFEEKRKAFEEEVLGVQREVQGRNSVIERAIGDATAQIREKLIPILAAIMEERGASVLLDKSQVLVSDKNLEVTTAALNRLNKSLPEVTVEIPEPE